MVSSFADFPMQLNNTLFTRGFARAANRQ